MVIAMDTAQPFVLVPDLSPPREAFLIISPVILFDSSIKSYIPNVMEYFLERIINSSNNSCIFI